MTDIKKKLQDEIAALDYEMHVELPKEILKARLHGDLSERRVSRRQRTPGHG
jgi:hypothetical protein